jgi:hypothetical protein
LFFPNKKTIGIIMLNYGERNKGKFFAKSSRAFAQNRKYQQSTHSARSIANISKALTARALLQISAKHSQRRCDPAAQTGDFFPTSARVHEQHESLLPVMQKHELIYCLKLLPNKKVHDLSSSSKLVPKKFYPVL